MFYKINDTERMWRMPPRPVPADPGRDESRPAAQPEPAWEPVITRPDPMTAEEREAWLAAEDEPPGPDEWPDPDGPPPPGEDQLTAEEAAGIRAAAGDELLALAADAAAGDGDAFAGAADHELVGVLCAWDRIEAHAAARKLAAVAELIRRRPEPGL